MLCSYMLQKMGGLCLFEVISGTWSLAYSALGVA